MKRRKFIALLYGAAIFPPFAARAQLLPRIGTNRLSRMFLSPEILQASDFLSAGASVSELFRRGA